jgi:hypothetical protein
MFELQARFDSVRELLERDEREPFGYDELDTQLWLLLTRRLHSPDDLSGLPVEIGAYFSSRLVQFEVCDGGFAQAVSDVPEWLTLAQAGYAAIGQSESAAMIQRARDLSSHAPDRLQADEAALDKLTLEVDTDQWEIDELRVQYVREHRAQFQSFD